MASDRLKYFTSSSRIGRASRALARAGNWFRGMTRKSSMSKAWRSPRRDRRAADSGGLDLRVLLEPARKDQGDNRRALDSYRRSLPAGRGRLFLVCRSVRRHAESGRPVGQPGRARTDARRTPRRSACGVAGCEDHDGLIKPIAYVVVRDGVEATPELAATLRQFARERLAEYKRPRWVEFVQALPMTPTGKVQRFKLRERAAHRADRT